jgi:hypothetical protein
MIRYLSHSEICKDTWDNSIQNSVNPLPYALTWWLDIVSPGWDALILNDYSAVMPLTWNSRLGIQYLRQPWLTQQLGIFSSSILNKEEVSLFLKNIPAKFRYVDLQLNSSNLVSESFSVSCRVNYVLDLSTRYIQIESNYHRNCRRNVQKALHEGLYVRPGPGPSVFSRFIERNLDRSLQENRGLFETMPKIVQASIDRNYGMIAGVYDRREELNAAGWFLNAFGRCFFIVCASTVAGKKKQAMHLLVDHTIREKAQTQTIFDFTGSNIPGIAYLPFS